MCCNDVQWSLSEQKSICEGVFDISIIYRQKYSCTFWICEYQPVQILGHFIDIVNSFFLFVNYFFLNIQLN